MSETSIDRTAWTAARSVMANALTTSFHGAIASVASDGTPYLTPVGSLMFHEPGRISYFELFATGLGRRLDRQPQMSLLLVDSGKPRWLRALMRGHFGKPPAIRLQGRAGPRRPASQPERERFLRRVRGLRHLRGGRKLWSNLRAPVRDLHIERIDILRLGSM